MISDDIKAIVRRLSGEGQTYRQIAKTVNIAPNSARNIILELSKKCKAKTGPKSKLNSSCLISIKRTAASILATGAKVTANKIRTNCDLLDVTPRTVRRALAKLGFGYKTAKSEIILTKAHKARRLELAKFWIDAMWPWNRVVWSDEKRFSLDGPDSWSSWVRIDQKLLRNKRQQGGQSIQFWGMILPDGRVVLKELNQRSNSQNYIELLRDFVKPFLDSELEHEYIFQQDNASIHVSKQTLDWMKSVDLQVMEWPARSPDLSPIENVWSLLSSIVYDGKQFGNLNDLRKAIHTAERILRTRDRYKIMTMRDSMQRRLRKLIESKGSTITY